VSRRLRGPLVTLATAVALAAGAASVASPALFAVAVGLVVLTGGAGIAVALAARRVTVNRIVGAREVEEGAPIRLRFSVAGKAGLPVRLEVEDQSGGWTEIGDPHTSLELRVNRRGAYWLAPSRVRLRDSLGIFETELLGGHPEPLLILPEPDRTASHPMGHSPALDDPEPHGLQPYTDGTSFARIHWPAYARGAGLHVRHIAPSPTGLPLVVVDTAGAPSAEALDWVARTAAGHILALARNGGCRVLLPGDLTETNVGNAAGEWHAMHRRLAMLGAFGPSEGRSRAGTSALHVRATTAPAGLEPPAPLPCGVVRR
jgi:uncharacterized protein (DUF58 family)